MHFIVAEKDTVGTTATMALLINLVWVILSGSSRFLPGSGQVRKGENDVSLALKYIQQIQQTNKRTVLKRFPVE